MTEEERAELDALKAEVERLASNQVQIRRALEKNSKVSRETLRMLLELPLRPDVNDNHDN